MKENGNTAVNAFGNAIEACDFVGSYKLTPVSINVCLERKENSHAAVGIND